MTDKKKEAGAGVTPATNQKVEQGTNPAHPVKVSNTMKKIKITKVTSNNPLTKAFNLNDDGLHKTTRGNMYEGLAEVIELADLKALQLLAEGLNNRQALVLGVFDTGTYGKKPKVVTDRVKQQKYAKDNEYISRTKGILHWQPGPTVVLLDEDTGRSFESIRNILSEVVPEADKPALLQRSSASACIYDTQGNELKGLTGSHNFLVITDGTDVEEFKEILEHRLWLAEYGYIFIDKAGRMHPRVAFDMAVFSPERLVFEAGADLGKGLTQKKQHEWRDGGQLDVMSLTEVSDEDRRAVAALIEAEKQMYGKKAKEVTRKYIREQVDKLVADTQMPVEQAKKVVECRRNGKLMGSDRVRLPNKDPITVADLIMEQDKYDKAACYDPAEPDYDGGRVVGIFYASLPGDRPTIFSQAHGGIVYKLGLDYQTVNEVLKKKQADTKWLKNNWKRIMALTWLEPDEKDWLATEIKDLIGIKKSTIEDVMKRQAQERMEQDGKHELMDLLDSEMVNLILKPKLVKTSLVLPDSGTLYEYVGDGLWQPRGKEDLANKVASMFYQKWGEKAQFNKTYWRNCSDLAFNQLRISWDEAEKLLLMNREHRYIPFANGVFDVKEGVLMEHNLDMFFRWRLPYQWEPPDELLLIIGWDWFSEVAPKFDKLLKGQLDRHGKAVLVACIRATILGRADLQFYVEMVGEPGSGKSTLIHVIRAILGEHNITDTTMEAIETNRFELAKLRDKRAAFIADAKWYQQSVNHFKAITGHDHLPIEEKNKQQQGPGVQFDAVMWMIMNEPMVTTEKTAAIERRKVPIYTEKRWSGPEDPKLAADIIAKELPQIFNCVMDMSDAEMERLISLPVHQCPMKLRNFKETNNAAEFIDETLTYCKGRNIRIGGSSDSNRDQWDVTLGRRVLKDQVDWRLFPAWKEWCHEAGLKYGSNKTFAKYLDKVLPVLFPGRSVKVMKDRNNRVWVQNVWWL